VNRPQPHSGWVAVAVLVGLAGGCAARQPSTTIAGRFVKGVNGSGGVAWPTADEPASGVSDSGWSDAIKAELSNGPRAREDARDARVLEESDEQLRMALEALTASRDAVGLRSVAGEYRRLRVFDRAYQYLAEAEVLDPRDGETQEALARLWRDWGLPSEGLSGAYRAVAADPGSARAENTLGTVLFSLGHVDAARERFERAAALDGTAAYARNNLCHVALMAGDGARAVRECQAALGLDPGMATAQNNLALAYAVAGRWDEAAGAFMKAAGDEAVAQYNLGVAYWAGGDYRLAAEAFETALARRPGFELARQRALEARRLAGLASSSTDRKQDDGRD